MTETPPPAGPFEAASGPQIVVDPSPNIAVAMQLVRQVTIIAAGATMLAGFIKTGDVKALVAFAHSDAMIPLVAAVITIATMAMGVIKTVTTKRNLVTAARAAPDSVAVVKGE